MNNAPLNRRKLIKKAVMGSCGLALGAYTVRDLLVESERAGLRVGFPNDAPAELWKWSREAQWYEARGSLIHCTLCPHECYLRENDRGFCRTRVVKEGKLHTVAYGNPCAVHLDPVEKKPLYHFLPGTGILSIATAGCNLRCLNCQNWEISQSKPEQTINYDLPPGKLVQTTLEKEIPAIAYTYSEPFIYYEYTYDSAALAREKGLRNVLVTAGYISEKPLRKLCKVSDAANVDLKGLSERFYRKVTGARLAPVLRAIEIMREEGVWVELTRLIVPSYSDDLDDIRDMCRWIYRTLGAGTPLHLSRFHPAHKLKRLPPTPVPVMEQARVIARDEGLHFVYVGNIPGHSGQDTHCPACGRKVIERLGYQVRIGGLEAGRCQCGEAIPGVWA